MSQGLNVFDVDTESIRSKRRSLESPDHVNVVNGQKQPQGNGGNNTKELGIGGDPSISFLSVIEEE